MGTSTSDSASAGSADSSAPSPRPSPRLVIMVQHLPSQFEVCGGATGLEIVKHDRLDVEHREHDPQDVETRVELLSHEPHGLLEEMSQPLERVELTLEWDEDAIGCHQSVDR